MNSTAVSKAVAGARRPRPSPRTLPIGTLILLSALSLGGCANMTQTDQRVVSGAAIGGVVGGPIGAGVGAGVGYAVDRIKTKP